VKIEPFSTIAAPTIPEMIDSTPNFARYGAFCRLPRPGGRLCRTLRTTYSPSLRMQAKLPSKISCDFSIAASKSSDARGLAKRSSHALMALCRSQRVARKQITEVIRQAPAHRV
jgi:hypothetical protein